MYFFIYCKYKMFQSKQSGIGKKEYSEGGKFKHRKLQ